MSCRRMRHSSQTALAWPVSTPPPALLSFRESPGGGAKTPLPSYPLPSSQLMAPEASRSRSLHALGELSTTRRHLGDSSCPCAAIRSQRDRQQREWMNLSRWDQIFWGSAASAVPYSHAAGPSAVRLGYLDFNTGLHFVTPHSPPGIKEYNITKMFTSQDSKVPAVFHARRHRA